MTAQALQLPQPQVPMVGSGGAIMRPWLYWFLNAQQRLGGASGGEYAAPFPVTVTASPFSYTATDHGTLMVSGGGVSSMTLTRGAFTRAVGRFYGSFPMVPGDLVRLTYVSAPILSFFPG